MPEAVSVVVAGLAAGGFVKGVIGVALPVVALPIITTATTVPQAVAMIALRLAREEFVVSTAASFLCAGVPLTALLVLRGVYDRLLFLLSLADCVPVFAGLVLGQAVRRRIDPAAFHRLLLAALALIGLDLLRRGLG